MESCVLSFVEKPTLAEQSNKMRNMGVANLDI